MREKSKPSALLGATMALLAITTGGMVAAQTTWQCYYFQDPAPVPAFAETLRQAVLADSIIQDGGTFFEAAALAIAAVEPQSAERDFKILFLTERFKKFNRPAHAAAIGDSWDRQVLREFETAGGDLFTSADRQALLAVVDASARTRIAAACAILEAALAVPLVIPTGFGETHECTETEDAP